MIVRVVNGVDLQEALVGERHLHRGRIRDHEAFISGQWNGGVKRIIRRWRRNNLFNGGGFLGIARFAQYKLALHRDTVTLFRRHNRFIAVLSGNKLNDSAVGKRQIVKIIVVARCIHSQDGIALAVRRLNGHLDAVVILKDIVIENKFSLVFIVRFSNVQLHDVIIQLVG